MLSNQGAQDEFDGLKGIKKAQAVFMQKLNDPEFRKKLSDIAKKRWQDPEYIKKNVPWNRGMRQYVTKTCTKCGIEFRRKKKEVKFHKSDRWYCSQKCAYTDRAKERSNQYGKDRKGLNKGILRLAARGQNNPMFDKTRKINPKSKGYREDLGHIVRSSWEANYCRILKYLGVKYEYESESFVITKDGYTYTPDFKINDTHFIELRGHRFIIKKNQSKIANFRRLYPNITLTYIDEKKYLRVSKTYSNRIPNWE